MNNTFIPQAVDIVKQAIDLDNAGRLRGDYLSVYRSIDHTTDLPSDRCVDHSDADAAAMLLLQVNMKRR